MTSTEEGWATLPRACPDEWTSREDAYCVQWAEARHVSPLDFASRLFIASTILAAGAVGAGLTWLLLKITGWLEP